MVEPARVVHAVIVLLAVGAYSYMFFRGVNNQASRYMYSALEEEVEKNPHMKKDLEEYKAQLAEQERQKVQMKELEEQAKRIQEQLQEMTKNHKKSLRSARYVQIQEAGHEESPSNSESLDHQETKLNNHSREQQMRSEL